MAKIDSYRKLDVWKLGIQQCMLIYEITRSFPRDEKYGIVQQMRRAAISVPANIAEGFSRRHKKEKTHFISIALGSNAELETHAVIAEGLGYIADSPELSAFNDLNDHVGRALTNFYRSFDT